MNSPLPTRLLWVTTGIAILTACFPPPNDDPPDSGDTGFFASDTGFDTDDEGFQSGPPMFQEGTWYDDCASSTWAISASTDFWVYGVSLLNIYETRYTKDYDEEHPFHEEAVSPDGRWSDLLTELTTDVPYGSDVAGSSTMFQCAELGMDNAERKDTIVARIYDLDQNLSDCIVWGQDPSVVLSNAMNAGIQVPAEILDNCVDVN